MTDYALDLDDGAVRRFTLAGRLAEQAERDQWVAAGITAGANVADIGCGPGDGCPGGRLRHSRQ